MQKDLFGASTVPSLATPYEQKSDFLQRFRIQLRLDQTIIAALLFVVVYVLVFSFGVESGKRYAMAEIKAERAMRERMTQELGEKIFANNQQQMAAATVETVAVRPELKTVITPAPKVATNTATITVEAEVPQTSPDGKFLIQTVTYTSKAAAEQELKRLAGKGYSGKIVPRGKFQQVCVGGFESRNQATTILGQLKTQGLAPQDAYIRTL